MVGKLSCFFPWLLAKLTMIISYDFVAKEVAGSVDDDEEEEMVARQNA